ncbi:MAG TPA: hypothetical protein VHZ24_15565 [Pirellulales bacterium]|jgi:hypothetical protein|nr:hypothetical protein [Pirellulales bacterium]
MFFGNHEGHSVEEFAVHISLIWQSIERIEIALNFVAIQSPINNGEIDTGLTFIQPQFVDDKRILAGMLSREPQLESSSYRGVVHDTNLFSSAEKHNRLSGLFVCRNIAVRKFCANRYRRCNRNRFPGR